MAGAVAGDTSLMYAYSTNEGTTWSAPVRVPTTGLANNVFAWAAAGDDGRVDIAWYGTAAHVDPAGGPQACPNGGPDAVPGPWSLYLTQTQNGHSGSVSFTPPIIASEHPVRRGGIQTIIGNQCGGATNLGLSGTTRTLGDFFQLRIGAQGPSRDLLRRLDQPRRQPHGLACDVRGAERRQRRPRGATAERQRDRVRLGVGRRRRRDVRRTRRDERVDAEPRHSLVEAEPTLDAELPPDRDTVPARDDEGRKHEHGGSRRPRHRQRPRLADAVAVAVEPHVHLHRAVVCERRGQLRRLRRVQPGRRRAVLGRPERARAEWRRRAADLPGLDADLGAGGVRGHPGSERHDLDRRPADRGQPRYRRRAVQLKALQRHREHDDPAGSWRTAFLRSAAWAASRST